MALPERETSGTVFKTLVKTILINEEFQAALLGPDEEKSMKTLYSFVEEQYPELKDKPEELKAKQEVVWESFSAVLRAVDMAEIGKLQKYINKDVHPEMIPI